MVAARVVDADKSNNNSHSYKANVHSLRLLIPSGQHCRIFRAFPNFIPIRDEMNLIPYREYEATRRDCHRELRRPPSHSRRIRDRIQPSRSLPARSNALEEDALKVLNLPARENDPSYCEHQARHLGSTIDMRRNRNALCVGPSTRVLSGESAGIKQFPGGCTSGRPTEGPGTLSAD